MHVSHSIKKIEFFAQLSGIDVDKKITHNFFLSIFSFEEWKEQEQGELQQKFQIHEMCSESLRTLAKTFCQEVLFMQKIEERMLAQTLDSSPVSREICVSCRDLLQKITKQIVQQFLPNFCNSNKFFTNIEPISFEVNIEPSNDYLFKCLATKPYQLYRTVIRQNLEFDNVTYSNSTFPSRGFQKNHDEKALLATNKAAFIDHPVQGMKSIEELQTSLDEMGFDPESIRIFPRVNNDETFQAFCWNKIHTKFNPPLGEIFVIGVHPDTQGSGFGKLILREGLNWIQNQGVDDVTLYVEDSNTSAQKLYDEIGFIEQYRCMIFRNTTYIS